MRPDDKYIESPFNTYSNKGLPPSPIANPSTDAIIAALNPKKTDCMYYFHDRKANFHCSVTYEEHVALLFDLLALAGMAATAALKAASGTEKSTQLQAVSGLKEKREELERDLANVKKTLSDPTTFTDPSKKKGGAAPPVLDKIDTLIASLKERAAKLKAMMPGLLADVGKADSVQGAIAEFDQKFKDQRFVRNTKTGKVGPSDPKVAEARALVEQNANLEMLFADTKRIAGEINKMKPDLERAMAVFADPLAEIPEAKTNQFDEIIARLKEAPETFKAVGAAAGVSAASVEELITKMKLGKEMGADAYLVKPFKPDVLLGKIAELLPAD